MNSINSSNATAIPTPLRAVALAIIMGVMAMGMYAHMSGQPGTTLLPKTAICPAKRLSGIDCPGCGMTRAFICIGSGDVVTASHFHPLSIPFFLLIAWAGIWGRFPQLLRHRMISHLALLLVLATWIWRMTG